jgi:hypothetical protein
LPQRYFKRDAFFGPIPLIEVKGPNNGYNILGRMKLIYFKNYG